MFSLFVVAAAAFKMHFWPFLLLSLWSQGGWK